MRSPESLLPAVGAAIVSGALVAVQGKFNGAFSADGGGPILAGWVSYLGTILAVIAMFLLRGTLGETLRILRAQSRWWWYAVGIGGIPIVISMSWGIPLVGIAICSVCSVAGQTIASLVLDGRGIGLPAPISLTRMRAAAGVVALIGLCLAITAGLSGVPSLWVMAAVGVAVFASGVGLSLQNAGNGAVIARTNDPLLATLTSGVGGGIIMTVIVMAAWAAGALDQAHFPGIESWWMYLGGPVGTAIMFTAAWSVRRLGTFRLTLAIVAGQMATALVIDALSGQQVTPTTIGATIAMACATFLVVIDPQSSRTH